MYLAEIPVNKPSTSARNTITEDIDDRLLDNFNVSRL